MKRLQISLIALCLATGTTPAWSHHSFAMFNNQTRVTLKGTVKEFHWTNPHSWVWMVVPQADGSAPQDWQIEASSPLTLAGFGWKRDSLKPGDAITMVAMPLKSGEHGGSIVSITKTDGSTLAVRDRN